MIRRLVAKWGLLAGVLLASFGLAGGCGGSDRTQALPPEEAAKAKKGIMDAMRKGMIQGMEKAKGRQKAQFQEMLRRMENK